MTAWAIRLSGNDDLVREQLLLRANQLHEELIGENPTAAEKLLADRVVLLQQQVSYFEMLEASSTEELTGTRLGAAVNKRQQQANRLLVDAIRQLTTVQKLQTEIRPTKPAAVGALRLYDPGSRKRAS